MVWNGKETEESQRGEEWSREGRENSLCDGSDKK